MKKISALLTAISVFALSSTARAEDLNEYIPYVGVDYTYTDGVAKFERPHFNSGSVNVGTYYNRYFGTELFYQYSDDYKDGHGADRFKTSFQAYGLDLMGYLPLWCDNVISLVGTVGIGEYTFHHEFSNAKDRRDHGYGYRAGIGLLYNFTENWGVRAMVRYVGLDQIEDFDHMMEYSAGIRYTF